MAACLPCPSAQSAAGAATRVTVLGAGAWGTAVALALAARHEVLLWGRNPDVIGQMAARRENGPYLPGFAFPPRLSVSADLNAALAHVGAQAGAPDGATSLPPLLAPLLILACPMAGLRPLLEQLKGRALHGLIWLCKGFEAGTCMLAHQVVQDVLGPEVVGGALSGPSFAQEVARGLPCALTVAAESAALRDQVVAVVHGANIRVYACADLVGVEVGGAVKNVLAIATGMADGLELGLNARAALITRGLAEITRLGTALGGNTETFMGLTGMGDLILTCTGDLSRNRTVGLGLAHGKKLAAIVAQLGHVAEGVPCARAVRELASRLGVEMPITNAVAAVLFDGAEPQDMVLRLLARDPRGELA
jgi:glycerol-3-phosphate dehydrogenase (NAD(P)+)